MPVNWQDPAVKDRLLASIIASVGGNINCKEVARLFGGDATYNAIENFLRAPKKQAKALVEEATASGHADPTPSPARPRKNPATPKKGQGSGVKSGRVTKAKNTESPTKKKVIKEEAEEKDFLGGQEAVTADEEEEI